jgi:indole-3-glycerol phosphate synthase
VINDNISVEEVTQKYIKAGAVGLSVLTDTLFFGGTNNDLIAARYLHECPILRKDFIIDEYQVIESKAIGADIILLIAAILSESRVKELSGLAKSLGLEVLLEVHQKEELDKMNENIDIIGVNNRNLMTFAVDIQTSLDLAKLISPEFIKISESGIHSKEQVRKLKEAGYNGFLIGENFMKESDPGEACKKFIDSLN